MNFSPFYSITLISVFAACSFSPATPAPALATHPTAIDTLPSTLSCDGGSLTPFPSGPLPKHKIGRGFIAHSYVSAVYNGVRCKGAGSFKTWPDKPGQVSVFVEMYTDPEHEAYLYGDLSLSNLPLKPGIYDFKGTGLSAHYSESEGGDAGRDGDYRVDINKSIVEIVAWDPDNKELKIRFHLWMDMDPTEKNPNGFPRRFELCDGIFDARQ